DEVYVCAFPCSGEKWQVSVDGGQIPTWSPATHELFFRTEDAGRIMGAKYAETSSSFTPDRPRVWLEKRLANPRTGRNLDGARDGKGIIALVPVDRPEEQEPRSHVIFLENFFDELRRRTSSR